jgi:hypothetical protein
LGDGGEAGVEDDLRAAGVSGGGRAVHGDRAAGLDGQVGLVRRGGRRGYG